MTQQSINLSLLLYRSLFGRQISFLSLVISAISISIPSFLLFELPPLIPLPEFPVPSIPGDYQAIVGILFFMIIIMRKPLMLLRHPRQISCVFVAGITYRQRQLFSMFFTKRKMLECLIFLSVFFIVRYFLLFTFDHHLTLIGLLIPEVPVFVLFGILYLLSDRIICSVPFSKKEYLSLQQQSNGLVFKPTANNVFLTFAKMFAFASVKPVHTMILRMVLYILRNDSWGALFLQLAGVVIGIVVATFLPWSVELLARMALLGIPVFLLGEHRVTIVASIVKTIESPSYYFKSKEIIHAGIYVSSFVLIPYILIYFVRQILFIHQFDIVAFTDFLLSVIALCLIIGRSFFESGKGGKDNGGAIFFFCVPVVMCSLMPIIGIVFSSIMIAVNIYKFRTNGTTAFKVMDNG
jgi:hypothetical protein